MADPKTDTPPADTRTIHERMVAILRELPPIGKNQKNQQQNFMFRGHDDVLNALNPLLARHSVFIVPNVVERVTAERTTAKGSTMYEVNLHVRYRFYGLAGDYVEASTWGEGTDMGDKTTNKAMTMAFKNALNQAFAISNEEFKDADAESPEPTKGRKPAQKPQETSRAAAVPRGEKMRVRIQELASEADKMREADGGTTWAEVVEAIKWHAGEVSSSDFKGDPNVDFGPDWDSLSEDGLVWLGNELKAYVAAGPTGISFYEHVTVPF